jgi:hypothetical protein
MGKMMKISETKGQQKGQSSINKTLIFVLLFLLIGIFIFFLLSAKKQVNILNSNRLSSETEEYIKLLEQIPEIQKIEQGVLKEGRKPFFTDEGKNGDIISLSLRESFPDDPHTSRIDTFDIDIKTKIITVEDVATGENISLEEWKRSIKERF